jgi:mono/diheme cytochrome c family protein
MTLKRIKFIAIAFLLLPLIAIALFHSAPVKAVNAAADDPSVTYKAKCAACHSPKAEKFFDPTLAEEELSQIVLKGKKGEKPPYMPGFETKGMTPEEAKALVVYMKQLREPAK